MPAFTSIALGGLAAGALGGVAGALGNKPNFNMDQNMGQLGQQGQNLFSQGGSQFGQSAAYGQQGLGTQLSAFNQYGGPSSFSQSQGAGQDLASLLQSLQQSGGVPSQADQQAASGYASNQFAQQRVNLQQTFDQQLVAANRQAALSGRGGNDPILRAKLGQERMRQTQQIDAAQQQFGSQYAQQIGQQRLGYAEGRANVLTSMDQLNAANRQQAYSNMLGLGQQQQAYGAQQQQFGVQQQQLGMNAMNQDVSNRFNQAQGNFQAQSQQKNGFDIFGAGLSGAIGGLGAGMQAGSAFGAGAAATTYQTPTDRQMWGY